MPCFLKALSFTYLFIFIASNCDCIFYTCFFHPFSIELNSSSLSSKCCRIIPRFLRTSLRSSLLSFLVLTTLLSLFATLENHLEHRAWKPNNKTSASCLASCFQLLQRDRVFGFRFCFQLLQKYSFFPAFILQKIQILHLAVTKIQLFSAFVFQLSSKLSQGQGEYDMIGMGCK